MRATVGIAVAHCIVISTPKVSQAELHGTATQVVPKMLKYAPRIDRKEASASYLYIENSTNILLKTSYAVVQLENA